MRRLASILIVFAVVTTTIVTSLQTTEVLAKTTSQKLEDAKDAQKDAEKNVSDAKDKVSDLKETQNGLKNSLNNLNSQLSSVSDKLAGIEEQIDDKEADISDTTAKLEQAQNEQDEQYRYIKARIRTMYEKGSQSYIALFLNTTNFSDFLNRAEYVEKVNEYDNLMINKYRDLVATTKEKKEKLEQEESELEALKADAKAEQEKVQKLVNSTKNSITAYAGEISEAEAAALAYEAKLVAAKNNVNALKKQLAEEEELARRSQSMKKRSLSEVTVAKGERALLGAIIQCEAGGEPYAGKIAVGAVIMNRVMSGAFPDTITGVVYQANQFEPVGSGRLAIVLAQGANATCLKAADEVLAGANNIGECLFFRTIVPGIKGTIIGHHVFYLYWTGKYSGYGTKDDKLEDNKQNNNSSSNDNSNQNTENQEQDNSDNKDDSSKDDSSDEDKSDDEKKSDDENSDEKKSDDDDDEDEEEQRVTE